MGSEAAGALQRQVDRLSDLGLGMQAAFEHEFMLLRENDGVLSHFETSHYASTHGLDAGGRELLRDLGLGIADLRHRQPRQHVLDG